MAEINNQFNSLETAVLEWFIKTYNDENLSAQILDAKPQKREHTGVGVLLDLDVSHALKPVELEKVINEVYENTGERVEPRWPVNGPLIESKDIDAGGEAVLWGKDGYIYQLEMFAFGDSFAEEVREFNLGSKTSITDARNSDRR